MKRPEWIAAVQELRALWPQAEIPDATIGAWYREVEDLPGEQVRAAIITFSRDGDEWPPSGGKIRKRVAQLALDIPDWGEVLEQLRLIQRTPAAMATGELIPQEGGADLAVIAHPRDGVIAHTHPMIVAFFLHLGSQIVAGVDPRDGGNEARLREKWFDFQRKAERRMSYLGLESGDLQALKRLARQGKKPRDAGSVFGAIAGEIARPQLPEGNGDA